MGSLLSAPAGASKRETPTSNLTESTAQMETALLKIIQYTVSNRGGMCSSDELDLKFKLSGLSSSILVSRYLTYLGKAPNLK